MGEKIAAFFDCDLTLLEVESARILSRYFFENRRYFFTEKGIPWRFLFQVMILNEFYKRDIYPDDKMALLLLKFYKGRRAKDFEAKAHTIYHEYIKPKIAPNILKRVLEHKAKGHKLVLVSAGVKWILDVIAVDIGFEHLLCTDLEIDEDGRFTGRPKDVLCIDRNKRIMAKSLANELNIDLDSSYAYGNHQSDIPLLELVGFPHVVEPTEPLKKIALEKGWPILKFR